MKTTVIGFGIALILLCFNTTQTSYAVTSLNTQYSCSPPFVANTAKPNIHFVLDKTGSMAYFPYIRYDNTYDATNSYYGYFKEDKYYKYDLAATGLNVYWQENASCTNTDYIGSTTLATGAGTCVSGRFLNFVTSNKMDIMRKILTGGRPWTNSSGVIQDATVLEHDGAGGAASSSDGLLNEATTNCSADNSTAGKVTIYSETADTPYTISSSSKNTTITFAVSGTKATITTSSNSGFSSTDKLVAGAQIATTRGDSSSTLSAGNIRYWTVDSISANKKVITVTSNTGLVAEGKIRVLIQTVPLPPTPCTILAKTTNKSMTVTATNKITRTDGGSFLTDGWAAGMTFEAFGFADIGNNAQWTIAAGGVTASVITITSTSLTTNAVAKNVVLTQNLTAYVRVKYATAETPFTGLIQSMYNSADKTKSKADIELSFFDDSNKVDYTGGSTDNNTAKNQNLDNYINAINRTSPGGGTNTGPALGEAEKFFMQVAIDTAVTTAPSGTGQTPLIAPKNGASDPYYDPPLDGSTATDSNSTAAPCRKSFIVLVSDGEWNSGYDPVGPAYHMHRSDEIKPSTNPKTYYGLYDLRPYSIADPALSDPQRATIYTVYAFGESAAGRNALITTAIFGGFEDVTSDNNNLPYPFTSEPGAYPAYTTAHLKTAANATGYTNSNSVAGTTVKFLADDNYTYPLDECNPAGTITGTVTATWDARCAEWDKSPGPTTALPTQRHTGLPFNYFEPTDGSGSALAKAITDAINDIFAKVSSGTAASILSNSEGSGANLLQAVYYPAKIFPGDGAQLSWSGEMQNLWYYVDPFISNSSVREDTDGDRKLNLKTDYITTFFFDTKDTKVKLQQDTNGDGSGDVTIAASIDPDDVKSIWRAGRLLHTRDPATRTIHTSWDGLSLYMPTTSGGGFYPADTRAGQLQSYLQATNLTESKHIISYIRGDDQEGVVTSPAYRKRKGKMLATDTTATEWKLGDIISSTPRLQSTNRISLFDLPSPSGYNDTSYAKFIATSDYKSRGMVYVGTNDGMMHAFKLGKLTVSGPTISGDVKAILTGEGTTDGTKLGSEQWAYIPRNALPYLKYLTDSSTFKHLYYVDGSTLLADVTTGTAGDTSSACASDYAQCAKDKTNGSNWRTLLIGSMGLGGATTLKDSTACKDYISGATPVNLDATCVKTPIFDPANASLGLGYSSYFALDITNQHFASDGSGAVANQPSLNWEFTHPELGYSTSGAAIVHVSAKTSTTTAGVTTTVSDKNKNGKTFAVFASGPTGPIIEGSFMGRSDQNLKLFVVDLGATGALTENTNYWVINTGIKRAFGGSMINSAIDTDRWSESADGNYQDDALYVGYSKANIADTASITKDTLWTDGGVIRLITKESTNPADWKTSTVISGIGAVTGGVARLQDRKNKKLWLYFASGRYFFGGDDKSTTRYIMGVTDSCYLGDNTLNKACADTPPTALTLSDLKSQATVTSCALGSNKGWYISLDGSTTTVDAERSITDPVALTNGMVEFTTFKPAADVCKFGGDTFVWAVKYDDGCALPSSVLGAKVLLQVSTGAFEEVNLKTALTAMSGRKTGSPLTGRPPTAPPPIVTNASNKPSKKILHIQEK
jgi:hypothetical protein